MSKTQQPATLGNFRSLSQQSHRNSASLGGLQAKANTLASNSKPTTANQPNHPQSKSITTANQILGNNSQRELNKKVSYAQTDLKDSYDPNSWAPGRSQVWNNKTVDADIKRCYYCNPNVAADAEAEYYENVRRLDECGHCWQRTQKYYTGPFKIRQKGPTDSIYQKDFVKHPIEKNPKIKNDFYGTFDIDEPRDFCTTMAQDYKPHKVGPITLANMAGKSAATGVPFAGRSGYKTEFVNWGNMPVNIEKPPVNISVIPEIPFMGKTAYQEIYVKQDGKPARPVDRDLYGTKRSPLSPGIPFMGKSTHNATYKPHNIEAMPNFPIVDEFQGDETYPNQFKTLYQKDYKGQGHWKCPAKIYMETHPHPRAAILKP
jgi:hypothetical protein